VKERIRFEDRYPVTLRPARPEMPALHRLVQASADAAPQNSAVWQDFIVMLRRSAGRQE
jgi:hypothetical protein